MNACDSTGAEEKRVRIYNQKNEDSDAVFLVKNYVLVEILVSYMYDMKPVAFSHHEDNSWETSSKWPVVYQQQKKKYSFWMGIVL